MAHSFLTILHQLLVQVNITLAATLLSTEMKTPRSLFFFLNGLLINRRNRALPAGSIVHAVNSSFHYKTLTA